MKEIDPAIMEECVKMDKMTVPTPVSVLFYYTHLGRGTMRALCESLVIFEKVFIIIDEVHILT